MALDGAIGAAIGATVGATDAEVVRESWHTPERFGLLYDRHATALHRYASQRVGAAVAEDVVAEVFLAAFAQRRGYDLGRSDARPWLFGILTNKIARVARAERIHYRAYARSCQAPVAGHLADRLADSVADRVSAQAMRGRLAEALSALSQADRHVLLLIAWAGLSYDEVAQALDIPVGTVRSRLSRARRKVRDALAAAGMSTQETNGDG
jgi:RNA polymerase sigma factor (sigma-70 family)